MGRGPWDYYEPGSYNAVCYECGRKRKFSYLRLHWQGYYVCPEHWEPRHPQDFVRGVQDIQTVPVAQNVESVFTAFCTPYGLSAVSGWAVSGCMISNNVPSWLQPLLGTAPGAIIP